MQGATECRSAVAARLSAATEGVQAEGLSESGGLEELVD